jgi:hypothetical protein
MKPARNSGRMVRGTWADAAIRRIESTGGIAGFAVDLPSLGLHELQGRCRPLVRPLEMDIHRIGAAGHPPGLGLDVEPIVDP